MIAIIDYRMGNLRSVQKALAKLGHDATIVRNPDEVAEADRLILPGVGAFEDAMAHLREQNLVEAVGDFVATGRPFLGICLGLQLLFDVSEEDGEHAGLGLVPGRVVRFESDDPAIRIPHMGWNRIEPTDGNNPLLTDLPGESVVYFVHSYYAAPAEARDVAATADYAGAFCAAVRRDNIWATQFHPEKSQRIGLQMLDNFARL